MKMEGIELYPHNQKAYDNLDEKKEVSTDDHHQADGRAE